MVDSPHEALHSIFTTDLELVERSLRKLLGVECPSLKSVAILNGEMTEIRPLERRADTVLWVETADGPHIFVIESQSKPDNGKRVSWPYYVSYLHARYKCPVTLLVVTADVETERWARQPIHIGLADAPTLTTRVLSLGPGTVPFVSDSAVGHKEAILTMFSALTHRKDPDVTAILDLLSDALSTVDTETAALLMDYTEVGLGDTPARKHWRNLMSLPTHLFKSEYANELRGEGHEQGREEGREEGSVDGVVSSIFTVLETRGVGVSAVARRRIESCSDGVVLRRWLARAVTVADSDALFD